MNMAIAASWFSSFLLKAFVSRVNRRRVVVHFESEQVYPSAQRRGRIGRMETSRLEEIERLLNSAGWRYDPTSNEFVVASREDAGCIIDADDVVEAIPALSFHDLDAFVNHKSDGRHPASN